MAYKLLTQYSSPNFTNAPLIVKSLTVHHWDDPKKKPKFEAIINWFLQTRAQVSAHYVVEEGRVARMVRTTVRAWHAGNRVGNSTSIGIECNPRCSAGDRETLAELIADLWREHDKVPVYVHNHWTPTSCPGAYQSYLPSIIARANEIYSGKKTSSPKPSTSSSKPVTKPTTSGGGTRVMKFGMTGNDVKKLQAELNRVFPTYSTLSVDGSYGPATQKVVTEFQKRAKKEGKYSSTVDGICGPGTIAALKKYGVKF